jgi:small subunit ribosomal protein S8e
MGGNSKHRALRLNTGNYNWASEGVAFKTKILNVVYNASNNELVRTNTLVKNTIVRVDATPFKKYVVKHYFGSEDENFSLNFNWETKTEGNQKSDNKYVKRRLDSKIEPKVQEQILKGQVLACISSRPGQSGRADGYILEGEELAFYLRKLERK